MIMMTMTCIQPHCKCKCCSFAGRCSPKTLPRPPLLWLPGRRSQGHLVEEKVNIDWVRKSDSGSELVEADLCHRGLALADIRVRRRHTRVCTCSRSFQGCLCTGGTTSSSSFNFLSSSPLASSLSMIIRLTWAKSEQGRYLHSFKSGSSQRTPPQPSSQWHWWW